MRGKFSSTISNLVFFSIRKNSFDLKNNDIKYMRNIKLSAFE